MARHPSRPHNERPQTNRAARERPAWAGSTPTGSRRADLSQHFLRSEAARRLVSALPASDGTPVLEIGAGGGSLTAALAAGFHVIAIEKDARLFRALRSRFIGRTNVECYHADVFSHLLPPPPYDVVSNLPYGITSAVVRRLVEGPSPPRRAWLIMQREAARKFAGTPRPTLFSLLHGPWWAASIVRPVSRGSFDPRPRVASALLRLDRRAQPLLDERERQAYGRFLRSAFGAVDMRAALRPYATGRQFARLAREAGFSARTRPPELALDQWLRVFRFIAHQCSGRDPARSANYCWTTGECAARKSSTAAGNSFAPTAVR